MGEGGRPCCASAAAARLRYLVVGGHRTAIAQLDEILEKAKAATSGGECAVRRELVRLVKVYNYVPPPAEKIYEDALFAEYLAQKGHEGARGNGETGDKESGGKEK